MGTTDQRKSPLQSMLVSQELSLLHVVGFPAQSLSIGFEFPEAVDGLEHATAQLQSAIDAHEKTEGGNRSVEPTEEPSELWLEAIAGIQ